MACQRLTEMFEDQKREVFSRKSGQGLPLPLFFRKGGGGGAGGGVIIWGMCAYS